MNLDDLKGNTYFTDIENLAAYFADTYIELIDTTIDKIVDQFKYPEEGEETIGDTTKYGVYYSDSGNYFEFFKNLGPDKQEAIAQVDLYNLKLVEENAQEIDGQNPTPNMDEKVNIDAIGHFYLDQVENGSTNSQALELASKKFNMSVDDIKAELEEKQLLEKVGPTTQEMLDVITSQEFSYWHDNIDDEIFNEMPVGEAPEFQDWMDGDAKDFYEDVLTKNIEKYAEDIKSVYDYYMANKIEENEELKMKNLNEWDNFNVSRRDVLDFEGYLKFVKKGGASRAIKFTDYPEHLKGYQHEIDRGEAFKHPQYDYAYRGVIGSSKGRHKAGEAKPQEFDSKVDGTFKPDEDKRKLPGMQGWNNGKVAVKEGLESHVMRVIKDKDPKLVSHIVWDNGMVVSDKKSADKIIAILKKSKEFGTAIYNKDEGKILFKKFSVKEDLNEETSNVIPFEDVKPGMKGSDYADVSGKVIATGSYDDLKQYDESGAMAEVVGDPENYGLSAEDLNMLVAVESEDGDNVVYSYGGDGFACYTKDNAPQEELEERFVGQAPNSDSVDNTTIDEEDIEEKSNEVIPTFENFVKKSIK